MNEIKTFEEIISMSKELAKKLGVKKGEMFDTLKDIAKYGGEITDADDKITKVTKANDEDWKKLESVWVDSEGNLRRGGLVKGQGIL